MSLERYHVRVYILGKVHLERDSLRVWKGLYSILRPMGFELAPGFQFLSHC